MGLEQISVRVRCKMPAYASESVDRGRRYPRKPCAAEVVTPATPHDGPVKYRVQALLYLLYVGKSVFEAFVQTHAVAPGAERA